MTRAERLTKALQAHMAKAFEAPEPIDNQFGFLRAAIEAGHLPAGNLRSYAIVLRGLLAEDQSPSDASNKVKEYPRVMRRYHRRWTLTEGEDGKRTYIFYSKSPFTIHETDIEDMKRGYANKPLGLGFTINQVCKQFGISRKDFMFVKTQLGWSKDQDEFTAEEHLDLSTDQLLEDREQRSRWLLEQEAMKREYVDALEKARKYDVAIGRYEGVKFDSYAPPKHVTDAQDFLVFPMADFHFEDEHDARNKVDQACALLDEALEGRTTVPRLLLVFQGDWFNFDTYGKTTTRGTVVGSEHARYMVNCAYWGAAAILDYVKTKLVNLEVLVVAGNHDRMQTYNLYQWIQARIGKNPDFLQGPKSMELAMYEFGDIQLLFEHGDGARGNLDRIIQKATDLYGVKPGQKRYLYTGHLHHAKFVDQGGVLCFQLTAPKDLLKQNEYEEKECYVSQRGMKIDAYNAKGIANTFWRWS